MKLAVFTNSEHGYLYTYESACVCVCIYMFINIWVHVIGRACQIYMG